MKRQWILIAGVIFTVSCSTNIITNENHHSIKFSKIESDYQLTDLNNYGCEKINLAVITHFLKKGTLVTEREVHDYYSTTGCSIKGNIVINGRNNSFIFDYGGIIYFGDGMILGCGETCCNENYPYCSWDAENLEGL